MELTNSTKAWYDPKAGGYRFYTKTGEEILFGMGSSLEIKDNWENHRGSGPEGIAVAIAKITCTCIIVNEKPSTV